MKSAITALLVLICLSVHSQESKKREYFIEKYAPRICTGYIFDGSEHRVFIEGEFSTIRPLTYHSYINKRGKEKKKLTLNSFGYSFLQFGYEYNVNSNYAAMRLGLFQFISKISFNPVQFIHQRGENTKGWIYRPEIGFGFWIFQLNYGYQLFLKNELRYLPHHSVILKIHLPF